MCGISGIISTNPRLDASSSLRAMTDAIQHRGPDDSGFYEGSDDAGRFVGLGHRRLAIIDLESGKQPITNEDGDVILVFNGEIYNYKGLRDDLIRRGHTFKTNSDSEVIVHAYEEYGDRCVKLFRGMFAFAIWDERKKRLLLARDRFGKKPLFYMFQGENLLFSSEIKSFRALSEFHAETNTDVLQDYLVYRYVPGPETLYRGVNKLQPGCVATYQGSNFSVDRYYEPPDKYPVDSYSTNDADEAVAGFLDKLRESVELRMVSDVPFGAFLSGGIDSTAIVALMSEFSPYPVKTFSVGFEESSYSELAYAKVVAQQFGTDHHELVVSHEDLISLLPELVRFRDAPVCEPSDIPIFMLAKEASKTVKMVLTGEGSDEILGGYSKHVAERYGHYYQIIPRRMREVVIEPLVRSLPYKYRSIKTAVFSMGIEDARERQPRWFGACSYLDSQKILRELPPPGHLANRRAFDTDERNSALRDVLYFDQVSWLPDNLLERGDRMTMAASIEARMPFMDHELAEYVSSLPDKFRIRGNETKWILRQSLKGIVQKEILERPKVGFRLPVNEWFRGVMKDYLYEMLGTNTSMCKEFFDSNALQEILREHTQGEHNHEKLLWTLLNLEIWLRQQ